jgi:hypothetical protein
MEMQLGMIAANRVLLLLIPQTRFKIQEPLKHPFSMVIFISRTSISYIPDEEVIKGIDLNVMQEKQSRSWVLQVLENLLLSIC